MADSLPPADETASETPHEPDGKAAAWYPQADGRLRWWDGAKWTDNFHAPLAVPVDGVDGPKKYPAAWHEQPDGRLRWWDGEQWTNSYRPASEHSVATGSAVKKGGLSQGGVGCLTILALPVIGFIFWLALGSPGSASQLCIDHIEENFEGAFANPRVTDTVDNAIATDVSGSFDGGTFACGLSKDPLKVEMAIVYPRNGGDPIVVSF